ncbi:MAG: hypothetical protein CVU39_00055 [Chloroflexi bacterium HGW-Chloroflexi-10]|nr:MAG: hypothetical protein CVU39_00055 [Chloroflexi bacterium HGW-Chloroflexi-10]
MKPNEIAHVAAFCKQTLDLASVKPNTEVYASLPLCVIDAVFSIGVRYASTEMTVKRFAAFFRVPLVSKNGFPERGEQLSIADLLGFYATYSTAEMAESIYQNRQRTSSRNGILKAEAVLRFGQVCFEQGVNVLQDVVGVIGDARFEAAIEEIPGQRSGISLRYFYMLAGRDDFIKPDRMVMRFLFSATGQHYCVEDCHTAVVGACGLLEEEYPGLTPRALDYQIWLYQRGER